jgi:hypothetical protein
MSIEHTSWQGAIKRADDDEKFAVHHQINITIYQEDDGYTVLRRDRNILGKQLSPEQVNAILQERNIDSQDGWY